MGTTQSIHQGKTEELIFISQGQSDKETWADSMDRELRLMDASYMFALAKKIIMPMNLKEPSAEDDIFYLMTFDERFGLVYTLELVKAAIEENHNAMCDCHERETVKGRKDIETDRIEKTVRTLFDDRETRTMKAQGLLDLAIRIIEPTTGDTENHFFSQMDDEQRWGLVNILEVVNKVIEEQTKAMCNCHERKKTHQ